MEVDRDEAKLQFLLNSLVDCKCPYVGKLAKLNFVFTRWLISVLKSVYILHVVTMPKNVKSEVSKLLY